MATQHIITYSRQRCLQECCQKHFWRYELGLRPKVPSDPLSFGGAFHEAIDIHERTRDLDAALAHVDALYFARNRDYQAAQVRACVRGHIWRWQECDIIAEILHSEIVLSAAIVNPETNRKSETFMQAGKLDAIARLQDGRLAIVERKTTGESIASETYWQNLLLDSQISQYFVLARANGMDVATCIYDVVHKPGIEPMLATPIENRKYRKDGVLYASQRDVDETPAEYEERLLADMVERPDFYFARREIVRLESDLWRFAYDCWDVAKQMRNCQLNDRWPRNTAACFSRGKCEYHDICLKGENIDVSNPPDGFDVMADVHPELESEHGNDSNGPAACEAQPETAAATV